MKPISDIRVYRSEIPNTDGNLLPSAFAGKKLNVVIRRIVMKLREQNFCLGDFDHLYLNFTVCADEETIVPASRSVDSYHKWYRYYDVGVSREVYQSLDSYDKIGFIIERIQALLIAFFSDANACSASECIAEAVDKGEKMLVLYKTKQSLNMKASVYLQYLDDGSYLPHLYVWNDKGAEVLHEKLASSADLMAIGEIQLSIKRVVVKPRKNTLTNDLAPYVFFV